MEHPLLDLDQKLVPALQPLISRIKNSDRMTLTTIEPRHAVTSKCEGTATMPNANTPDGSHASRGWDIARSGNEALR